MKIYFTEENKKELYRCIDEIVSTNHWAEGKFIRLFETASEDYFRMNAVSVTNAGAALYLLYKYSGVKGKDVIIPGNTCWPTVAAAQLAGANIIYADCNKYDLCLSFEDLKKRVTKNTICVTVVHIGGHIAFEIDKIAQFCKENGLILIEDCAHAHGATWDGQVPGSWGIGGAYSFYATKTLTTGEGGMILTKDKNVAEWCKLQRNYGKMLVGNHMTYPLLDGFNFRISEITAAVGYIQLKNLERILEQKRSLAEKYDQIFKDSIKMPARMKSGYYKYIVFNQETKQQTGKVFDTNDQCSAIAGRSDDLPNCQWIGKNHSCPPIYCNWEYEDKSIEEIASVLCE